MYRGKTISGASKATLTVEKR